MVEFSEPKKAPRNKRFTKKKYEKWEPGELKKVNAKKNSREAYRPLHYADFNVEDNYES